jgi:hypothetical protein
MRKTFLRISGQNSLMCRLFILTGEAAGLPTDGSTLVMVSPAQGSASEESVLTH